MTTKLRYQGKALSVNQPWANLIASGEKTIETRKWATEYRGPVLIVSTKKPPEPGPAGCAVALVDLVDCREFKDTDEDAARCEVPLGTMAWCLANIRRVEPIEIRGQHRLYDVDVELEVHEDEPAEAPAAADGQPDEAAAPDGESTEPLDADDEADRDVREAARDIVIELRPGESVSEAVTDRVHDRLRRLILGDLPEKRERVVMATFETHLGRILGFTYKANSGVHRITLEIPADPAYAAAMLRMSNEIVSVKVVLEEKDEDDSYAATEGDQPELPFNNARDDDADNDDENEEMEAETVLDETDAPPTETNDEPGETDKPGDETSEEPADAKEPAVAAAS